MPLIHPQVVDLTRNWLLNLGYTRTNSVCANHWRPDLTFRIPEQDIPNTYEVKPEEVSSTELRKGIMQTLEGFLLGYKSYLVIFEDCLPEVQLFTPFIPKIGIITYTSNGTLSINKEPELLPNEVTKSFRESVQEILKPRTSKSLPYESVISRKTNYGLGRKAKIRTGKRGGKFRLHKVKRGKHKGKIVRVYTRKK